MRNKARKILFDELEKSGWQWAIFNPEEPDKNNAIVECVLDAMEKYKNLHKKARDSGKKVKAIVRYIPMQGYMAQMIEEKELRLVKIKCDSPLHRGQQIKGIEIEDYFIVSQ